jgi:hypothetical protein
MAQLEEESKQGGVKGMKARNELDQMRADDQLERNRFMRQVVCSLRSYTCLYFSFKVLSALG